MSNVTHHAMTSPFHNDKQKYWLFKQTTSSAGGNLLMFTNVTNKEVTCNGLETEDNVEFHIYSAYDGSKTVCVLYCCKGPCKGQVLRINNGKVSHRKLVIDLFKPDLTFNDVGKDILFEFNKKTITPNNVLYSFRLRSQPTEVLGFTDNGVAMTTFGFDSVNSILSRVKVAI